MSVILNDGNFEQEVIKSEKPVLVDFWASWCGPCQMMLPVIDDVSKEVEGFAKVGKINIDEGEKTANEYEVASIPTLIFFKDGKVVNKMVGVQSKDTLIEELRKIATA